MYRTAICALGILLASCNKPPAVTYPQTARVAVVEAQFGEQVADPFRWLENDVRTDQQVESWVTAQNRLTYDYLDSLPGRDALQERLSQLWDYERFGVPEKAGDNYFYTHNTGLQNQSVLFVRTGLDGESRELLDPNTWANDGATALAEWLPSHDGTKLAFAVQDGGTDWRIIQILDVATAKLLNDRIRWAKFTNIAWTRDGSGIFYSRFAEPEKGAEYQALNENQQLYFHKLGTDQSGDRLVYATPDRPKLNHTAETTDDGAWLVIYSSEGTDERYELTLLDLRKPGAKPFTLVKGLEHNWVLVGSKGDTLYFITNKDAPLQKIVAFDAKRPAAAPRQVVGQDVSTIDGASLVGNLLLVSYLVDAKSEVRRVTLNGQALGIVELPGIGSASGFSGEAGDTETFFSFSSFNVPTAIFHYDSASNEVTPFAQPEVSFAPDDYVVEQRFFQSKDGTRMPLFLMYHKELKVSGGAPTLLYAYGGFNVNMTPAFNPANLAWVEMGGVYALANIRGGGEYGKAWHDAGRLKNKQNVFDDFIAASEFLIAQGVTTKDKLAIRGGSNGGLLVGAVLNQRPDLFAAALPQVGVMDMLRFNRFTAGRYWVDDYGYPDREADFRVLRGYSPYHNIRAGVSYPAILATTADTDDRVVPGHTFKYVAALQAAQIGDKPHLVRIETRAGHGSGKPTDKTIAEYADMWAFVARWTGLEVPAR
jgi:prolyl oligopeptidase